MLAYLDVEWTEENYEVEINRGPPITYDKSCWFDVKFKLGLEFPNLPYWLDGDIKLTQSLAITRHLARKYALDGKDELEKCRIDMLEQQIHDYRSFAVENFFYESQRDFEKLKPGYLRDLVQKYQALSDYLGDRTWFAGNSLSYADFMAHEFLDQHNLLAKGSFDEFSNLVQFKARLESLPTVAKYMKSEKFQRWPICNPHASFGSVLQPAPE